MSERLLTLPGSTDRFHLTDRPRPSLTDRYRMLPDGMNTSHLTVVRAHQVRAGDVVAAFFTDGPGTRYAEHFEEAFIADPHPYGSRSRLCPGCDDCEDTAAYRVAPDRYVRLALADDVRDCVTVFRNTPVAIVPADVAASLPPLHSVPPLPDLFALDGEHRPYEALPVSRAWGPYDTISVTRATAEQLAADLTASHAGRYLTCRWLGDCLLISSDPRLRTEPGRPGRVIEPDADGRYRIGGLWPWEEWTAEPEDDEE
ncbi:hypothetical protein [Streptomyces ardesiacus]|uniref:hypothetical protein n=1 Tax=Streptomyces ardesiacus TaxID=285564 RepID=UPI003678C46F